MFTDIAGYSAMMEENEPRTIGIIETHNEIVFPLIASTHGDVVDAIGDGLLVCFPSVLEAVRCGLEIQKSVDAYNDSTVPEKRFHLRIGIHQGEVWQNETKIFGNGVNIAARIQPFADPGGMCLSEDAERQVANKIDVEINSIGVKPLKNISRRIELFRVETGFEVTGAASADSGEFDEIKEQLLAERERVAAQRSTKPDRNGDDLGSVIENRVFNFVERVMDAAIDKWDTVPTGKKQVASAKIGKNIKLNINTRDSRSVPAPPAPPLPPASPMQASRNKLELSRKKRSTEISGNLGAGLTFGIGFGIGFFAFGISWMVFPMLLLGALPLTIGLFKVAKNFSDRLQARKRRPQELEQRILESASSLGGRVTVVQIATQTGISLDEASAILDEMTKKGYLLQHILETGVLQYEFPSLSHPDNSDT